jgi:hypothetical protein
MISVHPLHLSFFFWLGRKSRPALQVKYALAAPACQKENEPYAGSRH